MNDLNIKSIWDGKTKVIFSSSNPNSLLLSDLGFGNQLILSLDCLFKLLIVSMA